MGNCTSEASRIGPPRGKRKVAAIIANAVSTPRANLLFQFTRVRPPFPVFGTSRTQAIVHLVSWGVSSGPAWPGVLETGSVLSAKCERLKTSLIPILLDLSPRDQPKGEEKSKRKTRRRVVTALDARIVLRYMSDEICHPSCSSGDCSRAGSPLQPAKVSSFQRQCRDATAFCATSSAHDPDHRPSQSPPAPQD